LAVGEIPAEGKADQRQPQRGQPRLLAVGDEQRGGDADVSDEAQQRDRDAVDLGPHGALDLDARLARGAGRLDAGVVNDREVGRHSEADDRQHQHHPAERDPHETDLIASWSWLYVAAASIGWACDLGPEMRIVGVALYPAAVAAVLSELTWLCRFEALR